MIESLLENNTDFVPNNKGAIITGAAKRLGRAIAMFLAYNGYDIAAHYHTSQNDAFSLKKIVEEHYNRKCILIKADLTKSYNIQHIIEQAFKFIPNCHVMINNASIFYSKTLLQTTIKDYHKNYSLHVQAPFFLTQHFAKHCLLKDNLQINSHIINIIDANIIRDQKSKYVPYILSKKSLAELTKLSAAELGPKITVNAICPSIISDDILDNINYDNLLKNLKIKNVLEKIQKIINNSSLTGKFYFM